MFTTSNNVSLIKYQFLECIAAYSEITIVVCISIFHFINQKISTNSQPKFIKIFNNLAIHYGYNLLSALTKNLGFIYIYSQHPLSRMPVNSNIRYLERIFISPEGSSYRMLTVYYIVEPAITATLYSGHLYITTIFGQSLGAVIGRFHCISLRYTLLLHVCTLLLGNQLNLRHQYSYYKTYCPLNIEFIMFIY